MRRLFTWLLLMAVAIGIGVFLFHAYLRTPEAGASHWVVIESGDSASTVATRLRDAGIIQNALEYRVYGWMDSAADRAKAGKYALFPGTNFRTIARMLALGPTRRESQVTLIEGWTIDDDTEYLSKEKAVSPASTTALIGRSVDRAPFDATLRDDFPFLKSLPRDRSLEGYLFPDTYRIWDDQLPDGLVRKQLQTFSDRFATSTIGAASAPLTTLDEVVTLASIIEKEVRSAKDRRIVAGIFLRRLQEGMALQSDATLTYALGNTRARATAEDLVLDSPYNTYQHRGLPPGPICNPAESAMDAVLHPLPSTYRYFLTDASGTVLYASTFEEHQANRRKAGY